MLYDLLKELAKAVATRDLPTERRIRKILDKEGMDIATQNVLLKTIEDEAKNGTQDPTTPADR